MIRWAASRPAVVWATSITILLGGAVSFTRLALATRTSVELPRLVVAISWQGASAELVEMYVASPIEAALQSVRGVRKTSSESSENSARLTVDLEADADVQIARLSILERLEMLRPEFPTGVGRPNVSNFVPRELEEEPLMRLTLNGPYTAGALKKLAQEQLEPRLSSVPGVAGLTVGGGTDLGISVSYDPSFLRQVGLSPAALALALRDARFVRAIGEEQRAGGPSQREVTVRDQPNVVEDLEALPVQGRGGRVFRLGELTTIRPEEDARGQFFRIDGQPAIMLTISRLPGADAIKTAAAIRAAVHELEPKLPPRVRISIRSDESEDLAVELRDLLVRGAIAFAAVILVIAFMLRDARAVALVMGSAAVAIAGTALGLYIFKIPANMLTLAGLAMGIGILVQNGLVVTERLGTVPDTRQARGEVAARITPAVIGATLTTAVVLFPFLYLQGNARAAFVPFAAAFVMALGWSVLSSVVMIPALARGHRIHEANWPRARRLYARLVAPLIRWRWVTLVMTGLMLGGLTWVFIKKVPRFAFSGFGGQQRTEIYAYINFPRGSDPVSLDRSIRELEAIAVGQPGVEIVQAMSTGTSGANMRVTFSRAFEFSAIPLEMEERLTQRAVLIGGASVGVRGQGPGFNSGFGSVGMATFRVRVLGYSFSGVEQLALDLKERLERIPRVRDVDVSTTSSQFGRDRAFAVTIEPDRAALARFGLTAQDLTTGVSREIRGSAGQLRIEIGGEEIPVSVKAQGALDRSLDELRDVVLPTTSGAPVRIGAVSRVSEQQALSAISREDQQYMRIVAYEFRGPNKLATRTHNAFMQSVTTPPGYKVEDAGFGFGFDPDRSERGLWLVFGIGIVLVILSVALVFDSTWAAGIVFLSLPVALGGVIAAFWIAKAAFTREAAVGVILVVGHAVNQAILLVDAALARRRANFALGRPGLGMRQVLRSAMDRAGMIVLVTLSTMASLLPLAIGTSTRSLFGAIALAAAGGMLAGTLGAMFIVPAMLVGRRRPQKTLTITVALALCVPAMSRGQTPLRFQTEIDRRAKEIETKVVAWRRDIHQHPELSNREVRTSKLVADHLTKLGLEVRTGVAHTGVIAVLRGGKPGPVVALRADMDALPVTEEVDLPFKSTARGVYNGQDVGVMHACGHDNHVAILMGVAEILTGMKRDIPGTVKFVFQPAEEGVPAGETGGAPMMIEQGVLENPKVDAIFGLHVFPYEVGRAVYRSGGIMASSDNFSIVVRGRQTHGALPWNGVDPIVTASQIVLGLQTITSRQTDLTLTPAVVTVGVLRGGVRFNIIPDSVEMAGTIRTFDERVREDIHARVKRTAESIAAAAGATARVAIQAVNPVTCNDPALTERMVPTLKRVLGQDKVSIAQLTTTAEDFAYYQKKIPGMFFFLGITPKGAEPSTVAPNHSPRFFADEGALVPGMRSLAHLALDYLTSRK